MHDTKSLSVVPFIVPLINVLTNSKIKEIETKDERVIVNYMTFLSFGKLSNFENPYAIHSDLFHHNTEWSSCFITTHSGGSISSYV